MFTGIIERTARVVSLVAPATRAGEPLSAITQLILDPGKEFDTKPGDSIAVNGCCLTVTNNKVGMLTFDISNETLMKTNLGNLMEGVSVNIERAMKLGTRLDGHMVSGHVDCRGSIDFVRKHSQGWDLVVSIPPGMGRYCVAKGSITIDGVSLTINKLEDTPEATKIGLTLIPTTVNLTRFRDSGAGDLVNIEVDMIGKYVERLLAPRR
jgi:riboflavin synthase